MVFLFGSILASLINDALPAMRELGPVLAEIGVFLAVIAAIVIGAFLWGVGRP